MASLPGGLSLNALRAGPSDRLKGGPPTRALGPSFMEMPPLTRGTWPLLSHLPWLLSGNTAGWGRGLGRALRKEGGCVMERTEVGQCDSPRNFWALQGWCLEAVGGTSSKG